LITGAVDVGHAASADELLDEEVLNLAAHERLTW
jgi:hypothetical protein